MKAYKLTQWGQPGQYVDVPKPTPGPSDVLIRMKAAGLCRSDLDMVDSKPGSAPYANSLEAGYILGHENAGIVSETGSAVTDLKVGEAVVVHHMRHCGNCEYCTDNAEQHCEAFKRNAIGMTRGCGIDGGLAEFLLVPRTEVISIGDGDPVLYAPLTDAGVTAYHAIQTAIQRLKPGTSAALIGIGGLGSYGVQFVKLLSSARIFAIDNIPERLETAQEVGADETVLFAGDGSAAAREILAKTGGRGVDAIVDFVGTSGTLGLAAKISRPRGRIVLVGMQGGTLEVGWGLLATSCEFAISLGSTRQDLREVCDLARNGKLRIDVERFGFEELDRAYEALRNGSLKGRAVVVFS
ncbi:alcohol dehydrogenase GroES domain protein [Annulohypoxylon maeteangense]|uniref:alcohol dehydrogenase GroES domain protein n=1 Tax=Annulohypoxylon maeteangense TaxID=1927788 RepID=UPI002008122D|nr:alcohol dehydrogenase GroES domain protein [Annulohypoxylon maeteangense]KAI0883702.1 alcohol dehydrogenase GroES domain protein [Annulohypoxylon maeteangense]